MTIIMKSPNATPPLRRHASSELRAFSRTHLLYDFRMLSETAALQIRFGSRRNFLESLPYIHDSVTASFALRLRNLIQFFYNDDPGPRDIVAADYCPDGAWLEARPPLTQPLVIAQKRAEKMLLPFTLDRNGLAVPCPVELLSFWRRMAKLRLELLLKAARPEDLEPALFEM